MKSFRQELFFDVPARRSFINITPQVNEALRASRVREGLCLVNTKHNDYGAANEIAPYES
jgi:thiamine phosphate synthase YjbQ (UPF0047 family)